jgi:hypothetical protein
MTVDLTTELGEGDHVCLAKPHATTRARFADGHCNTNRYTSSNESSKMQSRRTFCRSCVIRSLSSRYGWMHVATDASIAIDRHQQSSCLLHGAGQAHRPNNWQRHRVVQSLWRFSTQCPTIGGHQISCVVAFVPLVCTVWCIECVHLERTTVECA